MIDRENAHLIGERSWWLERDPSGRPKCVSCDVVACGRSRRLKLHRLVMAAERLQIIDHRDRDVLNNRRSNLRHATHHQNACNTSPRANKFKGVAFHAASNTWRARIHADSRNIQLGTFASSEEAARAYDAGALWFFGDFAAPNFTEGVPQGPHRWQRQNPTGSRASLTHDGATRTIRAWTIARGFPVGLIAKRQATSGWMVH